MLYASFTVTAIFAHFPLTYLQDNDKGHVDWNNYSQSISSSKSHKLNGCFQSHLDRHGNECPGACTVPTDIQSGKSPP